MKCCFLATSSCSLMRIHLVLPVFGQHAASPSLSVLAAHLALFLTSLSTLSSSNATKPSQTKTTTYLRQVILWKLLKAPSKGLEQSLASQTAQSAPLYLSLS